MLIFYFVLKASLMMALTNWKISHRNPWPMRMKNLYWRFRLLHTWKGKLSLYQNEYPYPPGSRSKPILRNLGGAGLSNFPRPEYADADVVGSAEWHQMDFRFSIVLVS
jgi:hypothetical protein